MKNSFVQLNLNKIYFERSIIYRKLTLKCLPCMTYSACYFFFRKRKCLQGPKVNLVFAG